ncbi:hypothetical protein CKM354_000491700 [Cercospora kikuchii]|uniref:Xylanolytic transcriptional activator regulatory domain-containing protein n=1 Tax=Cercospora kikuchii TaxID=84275 RepID=A0A9P3CF31_9PEZI|nr:uncharacterized protein CKM354_000491700 [Cercospora kikuchii]GIZ41618.1 hypothetical protein CKM354_000491700 [Cercospora kikuchii]
MKRMSFSANIHNSPECNSPWQSSTDTVGLEGRHATQKTYPFRNYWTAPGGLSEALVPLPSKQDAEKMIDKFFFHVDPLYPIIPQAVFRARVERFWASSQESRNAADAVEVALIYIILATGRLFITDQDSVDHVSPETFLSCAYRALCLSSFLSKWSLQSIQVLILICNYFVMNNRTADSWTFSGIIQKQAYGLGLHKLPPEAATVSEKQLRCRLWQALMFQDVSLSYYLQLVPLTCQHSIDTSALSNVDEEGNRPGLRMQELLTVGPIVSDLAFLTCQSDVSYVRAMWLFAKFMQVNICLPGALAQPVVRDSAHKAALILELQGLYDGLDPPFNTTAFNDQEHRTWRQMIMVASNYHFAFTMLHLADNAESGVLRDLNEALKASAKAMACFFTLIAAEPQQAAMWAPANTRAYAQAVMIKKMFSLVEQQQQQSDEDPWLQLVKGDFDRYIDILVHTHGAPGFEQMKKERLSKLLDGPVRSALHA